MPTWEFQAGTDRPEDYHTFYLFLCRREVDMKLTRNVTGRPESCRPEKWPEKVWPRWKTTSHIVSGKFIVFCILLTFNML